MKNYIIISITILLYTALLSQNEQELGVFEADSTWGKEVLIIPLGFAREIEYQGFEDIRFAKGWSNNESSEFWTYTFAWHVKGIQKQTVENLETHLKLYFDGLMLPANNEDKKVPESIVLVIKNDVSDEGSNFLGKIKTFDRFHSQKLMTLNFSVKSYYCDNENTSTIVFRFSPKPFKDKVWEAFEDLKLRNDLCEH